LAHSGIYAFRVVPVRLSQRKAHSGLNAHFSGNRIPNPSTKAHIDYLKDATGLI
jgi:hypothetical protein